MFMNQWIKHSTQYPRYQLRLLDKSSVWFDDYGHTEREVIQGSHGFLKETYPHYTCGKGFSRWLEKHNRYSTDEAHETVKQLSGGNISWKSLLAGKSEVERRHALKDLSLRIPCRPLVRFVYMYFFLGGMLDGRAGFTWCVLQSFYEYMILLKVWEMRQHQSLPPQAMSPQTWSAQGSSAQTLTEATPADRTKIQPHTSAPQPSGSAQSEAA